MEKCRIRSIFTVAIATVTFPLAGCLVWNSDVSYSEKGAPLSSSTLDQVKCGQTTKDWVLATLGKPSEDITTEDGTEILKYRYGKKQSNNTLVLPFLIVNDEKEDKQTVYFEIRDGVVQRYWKETSRS